MNFIACTTVVVPAADAAAAGDAAGADAAAAGAAAPVYDFVFHAGAHLPLPPAFACPPRPPIIEIVATPLRPAGVTGATKAEDESPSASMIWDQTGEATPTWHPGQGGGNARHGEECVWRDGERKREWGSATMQILGFLSSLPNPRLNAAVFHP